jgi:hypothetical protein
MVKNLKKKMVYKVKRTTKQTKNKRRRRRNNFQPTVQTKKFSNYFDDMAGYAGQHIGIPHAVGKYAGNRLRALGTYAGVQAGIIGSGDYRVNRNSLLSAGIPQFGNGAREFRMQFREYLTDIFSSTDFAITSYDINPGLVDSFPWLAYIAQNFQQYRVNGLIYEFRSMSADALNSTNTALGTVIMATQYDSSSPIFGNKAEMENYEFAISGRPSCSLLQPVECDRSMTPVSELYIRTEALPSNTDIKFYDLGVFSIATTGSQAIANIGELWVSYDITFLKPATLGEGIVTYNASHYVVPVSGITTSTAYFGSSLPVSGSYQTGSNISLTFKNTQIEMPSTISSGNYILEVCYVGTSATLTNALSITATTNCTGFNYFQASTSNSNNVSPGAASNTQFCQFAFTVLAVDAILTLSGGTMPTALSSCDVTIYQLPQLLDS